MPFFAPDPDRDTAFGSAQCDALLLLRGCDLFGVLLLRLDCAGPAPRQGGSGITPNSRFWVGGFSNFGFGSWKIPKFYLWAFGFFQISLLGLGYSQIPVSGFDFFQITVLGFSSFLNSGFGVGRFSNSNLGVGRFPNSDFGVGMFPNSLLGVGMFSSPGFGIGFLPKFWVWGFGDSQISVLEVGMSPNPRFGAECSQILGLGLSSFLNSVFGVGFLFPIPVLGPHHFKVGLGPSQFLVLGLGDSQILVLGVGGSQISISGFGTFSNPGFGVGRFPNSVFAVGFLSQISVLGPQHVKVGLGLPQIPGLRLGDSQISVLGLGSFRSSGFGVGGDSQILGLGLGSFPNLSLGAWDVLKSQFWG